MKIGVFGDSYADKGYQNYQGMIWYNFLKMNHSVDCFGEAGSSILFSAELIHTKAKDYDLVIWCLTTPGRFSLPHRINDRNVHVTTAWDQCNYSDIEIQKKHAVCIDYLKYIFDWQTENFVGRAIVEYLCGQHKNIMIIPCFPPPLSSAFNLYDLCQWEAQFWFPGQTIPEIYKHHRDLRPGHISEINQKILADLIQQDLAPGVFQTSYDHFVAPTESFDQVFVKL